MVDTGYIGFRIRSLGGLFEQKFTRMFGLDAVVFSNIVSSLSQMDIKRYL